ncbi:MAG: hypothetical protein RIR10_1918 [Planctomycetota bacterium]
MRGNRGCDDLEVSIEDRSECAHGFDGIQAKTAVLLAYIRRMPLCSPFLSPVTTSLAVAALFGTVPHGSTVHGNTVHGNTVHGNTALGNSALRITVGNRASAESFVRTIPSAPPATSAAPATSTDSAQSPAGNQAQARTPEKSAKDRAGKSHAGSSEFAVSLASSELVRAYRNEKIDALIAKPLGTSPERQAERLREITLAAMRELVSHGFSDKATTQDRMAAIDVLERLHTPAELAAALQVLQGEAGRANLVASDSDVRGALMKALANDAETGQVALVRFAVEENDPVRASALAAMPDRLSDSAEAFLTVYLAGERELYVNRAASIASAHAGAALIPPLIAAQSTPPRQKRGDEAWIAIGKSISYVADVVPVVGDASGAFQPVPGTVFEGSVLRIMESVVTIYRTEVYFSLRRVVERETGQPAPPFGWDALAWNRWYEQEFPTLAAKHAEREARASVTESAVTAPPSTER